MPLPQGLSLNAATGALIGQPTAASAVDSTATDYTFTVQAVDANGLVARAQHTITIYPAVTLVLTYPAGTVGVAYSGTAVSTGGLAPKVYAVASGALPTSVSLNTSTGAATGTPTVAGTYTGTISVTSDLGGTTTDDFSIVIAAA